MEITWPEGSLEFAPLLTEKNYLSLLASICKATESTEDELKRYVTQELGYRDFNEFMFLIAAEIDYAKVREERRTSGKPS